MQRFPFHPLSLFGFVLITKDITFITQISLRSPVVQFLEKDVQQKEAIFHEIKNDQEMEEEDGGGGGVELPPKSCNLYKGKWVFDNITRPLYKEEKCEFLTAQVTCSRNGREDTLYQNWRWQPNDCSLPKFEAKLVLENDRVNPIGNCSESERLPKSNKPASQTQGSVAVVAEREKIFRRQQEKLRGKRLVFVGDSVNRNQWESMICLLHTGIAPGRSTWAVWAPLSVYSIQDYNATVEFYWAPFLVESNSDDPRNHSISQRMINPESISNHGSHWKDADILVFNTYIWWMNNHTIKVSRGSIDQGSTGHDEVERSTAYERVMATWADYLKHNVDHTLTKSFFISMSPVHWQSSYWNNPDGVACARESKPILNTTMELDMGIDKRLLEVVRNTIEAKEIALNLIDITTLSEYRKEAYTSVYTLRQGRLLTPEEKAKPAAFADCLHWCLLGVPDTWNELLYTHILSF